MDKSLEEDCHQYYIGRYLTDKSLEEDCHQYYIGRYLTEIPM